VNNRELALQLILNIPVHMRAIVLPLIFLLSTGLAFGQVTVSGVVSSDQGKLPYVNIGIRNKNAGTLSRADGSFVLQVPDSLQKDTLFFSLVGYHDTGIAINNFKTGMPCAVRLREQQYDLGAVAVTAKKLKEKKFGVHKYHSLIHLVDASINQNDIFEIAQLVHLPRRASKVTSVNLLINDDRKDSGLFRINFYEYQDGMPVKKIVQKNIIQTKAIKEGWLKFDLAKEQLYLKGDVVAAIEFLPLGKGKIAYEVKLGGRTKTFVRTSSQGEWQTPPAHYRMFVTALTADEDTQDNEEVEARATAQLYSAEIGDSFSLFVAMPKGYDAHASRNYHVAYVLDGNAYFDQLSEYITKHDIPVILFGVGYSSAYRSLVLRDRDFTFPKAAAADSMQQSGGADKFLQFLQTVVVPYIDAKYHTDKAGRMLMGHSLGGCFILYALERSLVDHRNVFQTFVAASPSLDYCNRYLLNEYKAVRPDAAQMKNLLLTIGAKEPDYADFASLLGILADKKFDAIKVSDTTILHADHMEAALPAFYAALDRIR